MKVGKLAFCWAKVTDLPAEMIVVVAGVKKDKRGDWQGAPTSPVVESDPGGPVPSGARGVSMLK